MDLPGPSSEPQTVLISECSINKNSHTSHGPRDPGGKTTMGREYADTPLVSLIAHPGNCSPDGAIEQSLEGIAEMLA